MNSSHSKERQGRVFTANELQEAIGALSVAGGLVFLLRSAWLPLENTVFLLLSALFLAGAILRPRGAFLFLIATLPFETLSFSPMSWSFDLRPYQWSAVLLGVGFFIRLLVHRESWALFRPHPLDGAVLLIPLGALVSGIMNGGEGMRLAVIVLSFSYLYFVARIFIRTIEDIHSVARVFLFSGSIVALYGIIQNILFLSGINAQAVMPGRPNGALPEPDWFGYFLVVLLGLILPSLGQRGGGQIPDNRSLGSLLPSLGALFIISLALILSVSRSAWLAALALFMVWFVSTLCSEPLARVRRILSAAQLSFIAFVLALLVAVDVPLTRFDLFNRASSTATGQQMITIACEKPTILPERIQTIEELTPYGCRHITLEESMALQGQGFSIQTIDRTDPNIALRAEIYRRSWAALREQPLVGLGWGNIGRILGTDERGAALNSSNAFLETWLGAGISGLIGWTLLTIGVSVLLVRRLCSRLIPENPLIAPALALLIATLVFNLFNAGVLIGFLWIGWACFPILLAPRGAPRP
jgi:hypothetical protein